MVVALTQTSWNNYPTGNGSSLYGILDQAHRGTYEHFPDKDDFVMKWDHNLVKTFTALLTQSTEGKAVFSLEFLLYRLLKGCVTNIYGETYWPKWQSWANEQTWGKVVREPTAPTRPGFVLADWQRHLGTNGVSAGQILDFLNRVLNDTFKSLPAPVAQKETTKQNTASKDRAKGSLAIDIEPEPTDTLVSFLDRKFTAQKNHLGLDNLSRGPAWCVAIPETLGSRHFGDGDSVDLLLDEIKIATDVYPSGKRYIRLSLPDKAAKVTSTISWDNGTLRAVWFRRMWRAWTLLWLWSFACQMAKDQGKEFETLLDFLQRCLKDDLWPNELQKCHEPLKTVNAKFKH